MAFIRTQKLVRQEDGSIVSGSASILESQYGQFGTYHSKQIVRESLGKVLYLSKDGKSGIFYSKTRGLVEYNCTDDVFKEVSADDPRISRYPKFKAEAPVHTIFGDVYVLLEFLQKSGLLGVFKTAFCKKTIMSAFYVMSCMGLPRMAPGLPVKTSLDVRLLPISLPTSLSQRLTLIQFSLLSWGKTMLS